MGVTLRWVAAGLGTLILSVLSQFVVAVHTFRATSQSLWHRSLPGPPYWGYMVACSLPNRGSFLVSLRAGRMLINKQEGPQADFLHAFSPGPSIYGSLVVLLDEGCLLW